MFLMLFSVWLILNGKITLEICLFGVAVCSVIYFAACRVTGFSVKKDWFFIRRIPYGIAYAAVLFWEIVKANCAVVRVILSGRKPDPAIVVFSVPLQTEWAKVLLANAITLTPGTITVSVEGDRFRVHALCSDFADGIDSSVFVSLLKKIEK